MINIILVVYVFLNLIGFLLEQLSSVSMSVYRDLFCRRRLLDNIIFIPNLLNSYKLIIFLGIIILIFLFKRVKHLNRINMNSKILQINILYNLFFSCFFLVLIILYESINFLSIPWFVLSYALIYVINLIDLYFNLNIM